MFHEHKAAKSRVSRRNHFKLNLWRADAGRSPTRGACGIPHHIGPRTIADRNSVATTLSRPSRDESTSDTATPAAPTRIGLGRER